MYRCSANNSVNSTTRSINITVQCKYMQYMRTYICEIYILRPGLKPGRVIQVIWVNWVTFCLGQVGLTQIPHWITCINNGVFPTKVMN